MRIGTFILEPYQSPEEWVELVLREGHGAAYCPVGLDAPDDEIERYAAAASDAGILIAEVHAWSNPISLDPAEAQRSLDLCKRALRLADRIGARCCVNGAGWRGDVFAGPSAGNFAPDVFDAIVGSVQSIIDAVNPQRTYYSLETMPWIAPYDLDTYGRLTDAIDRERFAAHFDPVNLVNDPFKYYATESLVTDFVDAFGDRIRSCHVKDIQIDYDTPAMALYERVPGEGEFNLDALLLSLARLDPELPLMLEHLNTADEYRRGAAHVRAVALRNGIEIIDAG